MIVGLSLFKHNLSDKFEPVLNQYLVIISFYEDKAEDAKEESKIVQKVIQPQPEPPPIKR